MFTNYNVPSRFLRIVYLHIIKNLLPQKTMRFPLLLGIHGPSGDGKTFQCEQLLSSIGIKSFLISGGQLESHEAGEPAQLVRTAYLNASHYMREHEGAAIVLINDIDTGLGNWGNMVQYTINRQTVFGELMHLVDYPNSVEGRDTERVPIIITGNDFTKLYEPLVRAGRMTSFEWIPSISEKAEIISGIFSELNLSECEELIRRLESTIDPSWSQTKTTLPVAFYAHLRTIIADDYIWKEIEKVGVESAITYIKNGFELDFKLQINFNDLINAGLSLIDSGQLINHLGGV